MRCLITGVSGFVGPYLKSELLKNRFSVFGSDKNKGPNVDKKADITDSAAVENLISETRPDIIYHLAAQSSVKISFKKPELTKKININGTLNLLNSVKKYVPSSKIIAVSSSDVYGIPKNLPLTEDSSISPVSPYGESKAEQEKLILNSGLNYIIFRSFTHIGPGQKPIFVCSDFARQIALIEKGKKPTIHTGDLSVKRDFSDVRDIVRGYVMGTRANKGVYNLCSGKIYTVKEILYILLSMSDVEIEIKEDASKLRKPEIPELVGDYSKFKDETNWEPKLFIKKTLRNILDYWRKNC